MANTRSIGNIDKFLKNPNLKPLSNQLSFTTADSLFGTLSQLPVGIREDSWKTRDVLIQVDGAEPLKFPFYYRDIVDCISFLMGHRPFKDNMVYSPVREYGEGGQRLFDEFHSGEWWWETQDRLAEGSTVVPLILASDKTQLTEHHGDLVAWPVYLTIGNLDGETRRTPKRPATLLLGFLPILLKDFNEHKKAMYHTVLGAILERMLSISFEYQTIILVHRRLIAK